ncbi:ImmA/IrrE family metallo-endopeptidase [Chryseobacterium sp.]|uniref:ImmA/IrrE family metallo-endopeptidase n=1 Tax=Chryseobacterium sp. TaxID=1871047 RepID=UPI002FCA6553
MNFHKIKHFYKFCHLISLYLYNKYNESAGVIMYRLFFNGNEGEEKIMCVEAIKEINEKYNDYNQMPDAAQYLLKRLNISTVPTPIVKIVQEAGFSVRRQQFKNESLSGIIAIDEELKSTLGSSKIISVNNQDNLGHQRFTIAHEFAHYIFDFDRAKSITYYDTYCTDDDFIEKPNEKRANFFAANLLMPADLFKKEFSEQVVPNDMYETTAKLAKIFQVSAAAVKIRLDELGLSVSG